MTPTRWRIWLSRLRLWAGRCARWGQADGRPEGTLGIAQLGHREYVGGRWDEIGKLQFDYLVSQGLLPEHRLLDVACGSLRAGVHLIPYLNAGNYWGLEKEQDLIDAGLNQELPAEVRAAKQPRFVVNAAFDVTGLDRPVDFIWMHSLFTHLTLDVIERCLTNLGSVATSQTRCFATFFETLQPRSNHSRSHDHETFFYTTDEMERCATSAGWRMIYIGGWGHPRDQRILEFRRND